ncbi:MAG: protein kinase, partial [Planctomycetes bacterium]|nr:protein kinase [Planctomycetota bacterium]
MNSSPPSTPTGTDRLRRLAHLVEDVVRRRSGGDSVSDSTVIEAHPDLMPELGDTLRALEHVEEAHVEAKSRTASSDASARHSGARHDGLVSPSSDSIPGFELLGETHRGGQGVVLKAIQKSTNREVAIKVMHEGPFVGSHGKARFEREVRILAKLKHPNIVTIHDSGTAAGSHYFVMDWITGRPLGAHMASRKWSVDEALVLFSKICDAVNAAHLRGIIHRDLKPSNILVDQAGEPHILDFGLAKTDTDELGESTQWRSMTMTGQFVGSLPWASPEQADGTPERIDLRTDVYSLGVILYQMLTGRFPYDVAGNMRDAIDNILRAEPARPSAINRGIDGEVETMLLKCLSKDRDRRYKTAGELARDLEHYRAGAPIEAKRDSTLYVLGKQLRRHRLPLAVATGFVLVLIASSIFAWTLYVRSQNSLCKAYLAQAQAGRTTGRAGQRLQSLEALAKAAAIRPSLALRNEAINCLALTDVRVIQQVQTGYTTDMIQCGFSWRGDLYWLAEEPTQKTLVRRLADHRTLLTLPAVLSDGSRANPQMSRDGRYLARCTRANCEVWDVEHADLITTFAVNVTNFVQPLGFSADGQELAVGCEDGSIHIKSLNSDGMRSLPPEHAPVHRVRYHPAGGVLATSSIRSNDVLIREAFTGKVLHTLKHASYVWDVAWSADGSRLVAGCADTKAYVWNTETGARQFLLDGHTREVSRVGFDHTGELVFSKSWDGTTGIWDQRDGTLLLTIPAMSGEAFVGDSKHLGFRSFTNGVSIGIAEVVHGDPLRTLVGRPGTALPKSGRSSRISEDGRWITYPGIDGIRIFDLWLGTECAFLPTGASEWGAFAPDMSELVTVADKRVLSWPVAFDAQVMRIGPPKTILASGRATFRHSVFVGDGRKLIVASLLDGHAIVLNSDRIQEPQTIGPHARMSRISISPDDRLLATGTWKGEGVR